MQRMLPARSSFMRIAGRQHIMQTLTKIFGVIVPTFFSTQNGVSISEVSRRQAEAKQQNDSFWSRMEDACAGVFKKTLKFVGAGHSVPQTVDAVAISTAEIGGYIGVAERNAETAVLMHGVKLYKRLQQELQRMDLRTFAAEVMPVEPAYPQELSKPVAPARPKIGTECSTEAFMDLSNIDEMVANMKTEVLAQFDFAFFAKAQGLNARAAAIGKLLSDRGSLFRELVKRLPAGGQITLQGGVIIESWSRTYSDEQLAELNAYRDGLQTEYNSLQQQLNGCKKQIKDAVRAYNLEQERLYQSAYREYQLSYAEYQAAVKQQSEEYQRAYQKYVMEMEQVRSSAETLRQQALQEIATLRVKTE